MSRAEGRNPYRRLLFTTLLQELGDESSPASLVTGAYTRAVVAVEVFMEGNQIAPVWIVLKLFVRSKHRPALISVEQEDS